MALADPALLPNRNHEDFLDTCYFKHHEQLPSPSQVLADAEQRGDVYLTTTFRRWVMIYPEQGLVVKFGDGSRTTIGEGQCLWFLKKHTHVPVPELFGWRLSNGQVFLYVQYMQGDSLDSVWDDMDDEDRLRIAKEIQRAILSLRRIKRPEQQAQHSSTIGQIGGQPLRDWLFEYDMPDGAGPYDSLYGFHKAFGSLASMTKEDKVSADHPDLGGLFKDRNIIFTHGDLAQQNIIVSKDAPHRLLAIVDWHQSGWYPEDWEFLKARRVAYLRGAWVQQYLPQILPEPDSDYEYSWEWVVKDKL